VARAIVTLPYGEAGRRFYLLNDSGSPIPIEAEEKVMLSLGSRLQTPTQQFVRMCLLGKKQ